MAKKEDFVILSFRDSNLQHFSQLSSDSKIAINQQLHTLVSICAGLQEQGEKIRSVKSLIWAFLKHFQCVGPSDLLTHIHEGDFVDAYGFNHRMLFAGLTFFEVFNYSLEEFFCCSWFDLFERKDQTVQQQLLDLSHEMVIGKHQNIISTKYIPHHLCQEKASKEKMMVRVEPQFFAPLFHQGRIIGYLCVNRGQMAN